jgi:hypothetical protein
MSLAIVPSFDALLVAVLSGFLWLRLRLRRRFRLGTGALPNIFGWESGVRSTFRSQVASTLSDETFVVELHIC